MWECPLTVGNTQGILISPKPVLWLSWALTPRQAPASGNSKCFETAPSLQLCKNNYYRPREGVLEQSSGTSWQLSLPQNHQQASFQIYIFIGRSWSTTKFKVSPEGRLWTYGLGPWTFLDLAVCPSLRMCIFCKSNTGPTWFPMFSCSSHSVFSRDSWTFHLHYTERNGYCT